MRIEIKRGTRHRQGETWTRRDRVIAGGIRLHGSIESSGRRKRPDTVVTRFGAEMRPGSDVYWLLHKNGAAVDPASTAIEQ